MAPATAGVLEPQYYVTEHDTTQFLSHLSAWKAKDPSEELRQSGFPSVLRSPLVWDGADVAARETEWVVVLSEQDVTDIDKGLAHFKGLGISATEMTQETFPLSVALKARLEDISKACYDGIGFAVLRGLDPEKHSEEDNARIFMGISTYVAPERAFQDRKREQVLCHIVNAAASMEEKKVVSPGFTAGAMSFHSDEGEILSLYVVDSAETGGRTQLASAWKIYNTIASKRPEIIKRLADSWTLDTFQDYNAFPPKLSPFLHVTRAGRPVFTFSRYPLTGFGPHRKRNASLPPVTGEQLEALNAVEVLAKESCFPLPTRRGDVVYINNMALLHGREPFTEGAAAGAAGEGEGGRKQRHLMKLCLRDPRRGAGWEVPKSLAPAWERIYGANREGGARVEKACLVYHPGQVGDWTRNG